MVRLSDITDALTQLTRLHPHAIERTARKLANAGLLSSAVDGMVPRDGATLVVALAAGRSPIDSVAAVEASRRAPLAAATTMSGAGEIALVIEADRQPVLDVGEWNIVRRGVIDALSLLITKIPVLHRAGREHAVCLQLATYPSPPMATVSFVHQSPRALRLIYSDPQRRDFAPWMASVFVDERVFNGIAALFDNPETLPEATLQA